MNSKNNESIYLAPDERGIIIGQTGSGKTVGAIHHLQQSAKSPVIIIDTKGEPAFDAIALENETIQSYDSIDDFLAALKSDDVPDYMIVRPEPEALADVQELDNMLLEIYNARNNTLVYIDEAYQLHKSAQAGPGLIALLTRGRSRNISTLISTQRPAWISRFCFSECQKIYLYMLTDARDYKTVREFVPDVNPEKMINLFAKKQHMWYFYNVKTRFLQAFGPVPIYKRSKLEAVGLDISSTYEWI